MRIFNVILATLLITFSMVVIGCSDDNDSTTEPESNTLPEITSEPVTNASIGQEYVYDIEAMDEDGDDLATTATVLPEWLNLSDAKEGTTIARLSGTPGTEHSGDNPVTLEVSDGNDEPVEQNFVITVDLHAGDLVEIEISCFDYYLGIVAADLVDDISNKAPYHAVIQSLNDSQPITSADLKIDGENVPLQGYLYAYYGEIEAEQGQNISFEATINGRAYIGELTIPYRPQNVTFPETFDPTESYDITWQLSQDSQYQLFEAHGWNADESYEVQFEELLPSNRSFTIPANWVGDDWNEYDLVVSEFSVYLEDKFIGISIDGDWAYHGFDIKTKNNYIVQKVEQLIRNSDQ